MPETTAADTTRAHVRRMRAAILANATRVRVRVPVVVMGETQWRETTLANMSREGREHMLRQWQEMGYLARIARPQ